MKRLVIHLGLPKTATTSLQSQVFPSLPGYLGTYPGRTFTTPAFSALRDAYIFGTTIKGQRVFELDGEESWLSMMNTWIGEVSALNDGNYLLSDEGLCVWRSPPGNGAYHPVMDAPGALPRRGAHPVISFLSSLRAGLPLDVDLKIVLVLRNQSDWLASLAAELGVRNTNFVSRLIQNDDAFLDYHKIVQDLEQALGSTNCKILFFEQGLEFIAMETLQFVGHVPSNPPTRSAIDGRENVRRTSDGWQGQKRWHVEKVEPFIDRVRALPLLSEISFLRSLGRTVFGYQMRRKVLRPRSFTISLSEEQRSAIRSHCKESNLDLARHVQMNLEDMGY